MRKIAACLILLLLAWLSNRAYGQNCTLSGTSAWSEHLKNVIADCDNRYTSPNGKLFLLIDAEGKIQVSDAASKTQMQVLSHAVEPPAMVSWSPSSVAFFINDGEGSGMASTFRLFLIKNDRVIEDKTVERKAVSVYRDEMKCDSVAADPNVWGIGWSPDGTSFHLLIQATVNSPCGKPGSFISMTIGLANGSILERLPEEATKVRFQSLLPRELYSK